MLLYHSVARLAHTKHSPTRERREVCFATTTGGTTGGMEGKESKESAVRQLSIAMEQRLEEARQMISLPEILERENVDALRESFYATTNTIRTLLSFANNEKNNEEAAFKAVLKAEEALSTLENSLYAVDEGSSIRRRLQTLVPGLRNREELDRDKDGLQKRIEYGKQHDRALALLREASAPGTLPQERQDAVREAAKILAGLETVDAGLEEQKRKDIAKIIHETRDSLKALLPQLKKLDALNDSVLDGRFFDGKAIIQKTHDKAMKLLEDAEQGSDTKRPLDKQDPLKTANRAKYRLQQLNNFLQHVTSVDASPKGFSQEQLATLTGKVDAFYSRDDKTIAVHQDLDNDPKVKADKLAHEKRHAYLHALEGLDEETLTGLYLETLKSPQGARIKELLQNLTSGDKPHYAYKLYKEAGAAAFEELLVRSCDEKAGVLTLDPRETELLALLQESHPPANTESSDVGITEGGKRYSSTIEDAEAEEDTPKKGAKEKEEEPEKLETAHELLVKVKSAITKMNSVVKELDETESLITSVIKDPVQREKTLDAWKAHRNILKDSVITLWSYEQILQDVESWNSGQMNPEAFNAVIAKITKTPPGSADGINVCDDVPMDKWSAANVSSKAMMAQDYSSLSGVDGILKGIQDHLKLFDGELPNVQDNIINLKKAKERGEFEGGGVGGFLGLEFYSINMVIESVKNVWNSYTKAWDNWSQLKVSKLSNQLGKLTKGLPFYDQASIALEMDLDHKNDEIKDEYKKHLEHDLASFDHCFHTGHKDHSLFHMNIDDPNRFRGTLEYMAGNGWLYDIDPINGTIFNVPIADYLPSTWPKIRKEMYIRDLEQQNSSGEEKASKNGLSRVDTYPDIPPMMVVLQDELKRHNFWAVKGIVERAIQKGKTGETSTWASTIILNAIKTDEITRKYFPKALMDQLGNIAISSPAWTSTFFKLNRNEIVAFQNEKIDFESAGTLAASISAVEKQIMRVRAASGLRAFKVGGEHEDPEDRAKLDRLVGQVLACQVVDGKSLPGIDEKWTESLSIFDDHPGFAHFRTEVENFKGTIEPGKCDDDFYNAVDNGNSESILKSPANFDTIFQPTSQGTFVNAQKAIFFLEQLVLEFDKLQDRYLKAKGSGDAAGMARTEKARNVYQKMMYHKMSYVATNAWQQGTCGLLVNIKGRCHDVGGKRAKESTDYIIYELARRKMFPWPEDLHNLLDKKETHFQGRFAAQVSRLGKNELPLG